jgi:hypothetical protein
MGSILGNALLTVTFTKSYGTSTVFAQSRAIFAHILMQGEIGIGNYVHQLQMNSCRYCLKQSGQR